MEKITLRLLACNNAMEYAACNHDGSILDDLPNGIIESTGVSDTLLIEVRKNNELIEQMKNE